MDTINVTIKQPIEISKELERINFTTLLTNTQEGDIFKVNDNRKHSIHLDNKNKKRKCLKYTQFVIFQKSMKVMLILGQCVGLNPFLGVLGNDTTKIRYTMFSVRFVYAVLIMIGQIIGASVCFYRLMRHTVSVGLLGYFSFYLSTGSTTFLFLRIGQKWPKLVRSIEISDINEFVNNKTVWKCNAVTALLFTLAFLEHIFSTIYRIVHITDCQTNDTVIFKEYIKFTFPWLGELTTQHNLSVAIFLQFHLIVTTLIWNYSDLFVVCMSIYLTGILEKINEKVCLASKKTDLTPSFWRSLREAYNSSTQLVRHFDDVMSGIIFTSFATNLFFICLQLFNILANGITSKTRELKELCPFYSSGPFGGYEDTVYLIFSLFVLFGRSLAVCLYVSEVHTASQAPATALYDVPSSMYCEEIQRFIDQVHEDKVALSGLHFFYVTREMALSIAATIVTYELVLLQFSAE